MPIPSSLTLRHYEMLPNTPALRLAVAGWHDLLTRGLIDEGATAVNYDHQAIVAFALDEPVGVLTWIDHKWANQVAVVLAYVLPDHRRHGIHTAMWNALIEKARELKRPVIASGTAMGNLASRLAMERQGRSETAVNVIFRVPLNVENVSPG